MFTIDELYQTCTTWQHTTLISIKKEKETPDLELTFEELYCGFYDIEASIRFGNEKIKWFDIVDHKFLINTHPEEWRTRKMIYIVI